MAEHPVRSTLQVIVLCMWVCVWGGWGEEGGRGIDVHVGYMCAWMCMCWGVLLTVAFSALMACSCVNPRDITMATLSSLGAAPVEEEEEEGWERGGWKGDVKSGAGER